MPAPIVTVPADLWENIKAFVEHPHGSHQFNLREMLERMRGVDVPDLSDEAELRRERIVELAGDMNWVAEGQVEIDSDARLSEGDDNGCYVSGWIWCDFDDTEFDKSCAECGEVVGEDSLTETEDHGKLCEDCLKELAEEEADDED